MPLQWTHEVAPAPVFELVTGEHAVLSRDGGSSIAVREAGGWREVAAVEWSLATVAALGDGSLVAAGPGVMVHVVGGRTEVREVPAACSQVWGPRWDCVYAIAGPRLMRFDGRWRTVDLAGQGIEGAWADGACDASGLCWIVGTFGTHSCMATGMGDAWTTGGCGSWYLYRVAVDAAGTWFAAGGDGLWRLTDGVWRAVEAYREGPGIYPMGLQVRDGAARVIGTDVMTLAAGRGVPALAAFVDGRWTTVELPTPLVDGAVALTDAGGLRLGEGVDVWESSPLA